MLHWAHGLSDAVPEIQTSQSLVVILVVLVITTIASLIKSRRDPEARAHTGSLRAARAAQTVGAEPATAMWTRLPSGVTVAD